MKRRRERIKAPTDGKFKFIASKRIYFLRTFSHRIDFPRNLTKTLHKHLICYDFQLTLKIKKKEVEKGKTSEVDEL